MLKRQNTSNALLKFNKNKTKKTEYYWEEDDEEAKSLRHNNDLNLSEQGLINISDNQEDSFQNFNQNNINQIDQKELNDLDLTAENIIEDDDVIDNEENIEANNKYNYEVEEDIEDQNFNYQQLNFATDQEEKEEIFSLHEEEDEEEENDEFYNIIIERYKPAAFSIVTDSLEIVKHVETFKFPKDNLNLLHKGGEFLKGDFARDTNAFIKRNALSSKQEAEMFYLLKKYFKGSDLPMELSKKKNNYISVLNDYSEPLNSFKRYDICKNGCCVFVGEVADAMICPICKEFRYRKNKQSVNNFNNNKNVTKGMIAYKQLNYRPIIPLFCFLLSQPGFLIAFNYEYVYGDYTTQNSYKYTDISQGIVYNQHLEEMKENFELKCKDDLQNIINIPILLSEFYDGVMISKRKVSHFLFFLLIIYYLLLL
jgi:hypothetical protein